jgi:DNA-binding NarL/FixJ family response regulator
MRRIHISIISAFPITLQGFKSLFTHRKYIPSAFCPQGEIESLLNFLNKKKSDIIILDDLCCERNNFYRVIDSLLNLSFGTRIVIYTDSRDAEYLKVLIKRGIRGILHKRASVEKIFEAIELINIGEFYYDNIISSSVFKYNAFQNIHQEIDIKKLSGREIQLLDLISDGVKNNIIAEKLFISKGTVGQHKAHLIRKLKLKSTAELTIFAAYNQNEIKSLLESEA